LALALLVVVVLDPWAAIAPGFWLSFSAVALIAYVSAARLKRGHWLQQAMHTQWAISIGLLPLLVAMFGQTSIVSPIANAIAIPVISLLVVPVSILGALLPFDAVLQAAHGILALCMQFLHWVAAFPLATWQQAAAPAWAALLAIAGVLWLLLPRGLPQRWLGFLLLLPMLLTKPEALREGELAVSVLDVGQGLAVVLKTAGHAMLYDAGPRFNAQSDAGARIVVPHLRGQGIQHLDGLVLSHDDVDHTGGADAVLAQVPTQWLLDSFAYEANDGPRQMRCHAGQRWQWDGVRFEVLSPTLQSYQDAELSDNNRSCVIKVSSAHGSVLLTGDIEKEVEMALLEANQDALGSDVLVVPHHGSKTSSTPQFLEAVAARRAVMTVGYLNRFKHPKPSILQRYQDGGTQVYRSDYHGALEFCFCGESALQALAWRQTRPRYWQDKNL
jgi:competence protein ComEC